MPPAGFLENPHLKFLLFGGKGGVGKTTTAVAAALRQAAARRTTGEQVLLVSTDPAHSLGDSLGQPIGDEITPVLSAVEGPVRGLGTLRLFAWEVDAARRLEQFKARYGEVLKTIADRGTYLDQDDIASFFDLSLPGIDELMVIIELADLVRQGTYGLIVVDTAPTGHTLRLLGLPALMEQWIHLLDLMLEKHRYMLRVLARRRRGPPDEAERFLQKMSADQGLLRALLADPRCTEFVPVLIPEAMAIEETGRLIDALAGLRVPVHTLVVNRVAIWRDCPFCQARHREQAPALGQIEARFAKQGYHLAWVPWAARPVQGLPALEAYAQALFEETPPPPAHLPPTLPPLRRPHPTPHAPAAAFAPLWKDLDCELLLFGGKGGVGKTTLAAAAALGLVERHPGQRVLIFSTDPAHSLSDSFMQPIGNQVTPVLSAVEGPVAGGHGLHALEMDAAVFMEELKQLYAAQTDEAFEAFVGRRGVDAPFDRAVMEALVSTTPPGLDELMALLKIMDFMKEGRFDRYILDLAPTGHALRFLETPGLVRQWFQALTRLVLKYRSVVSLTKVGEWLLEQSRRLRRVEQLLPDPARCRFVAVSIPEAMAVDETERLLGRLTGLAIACPIVIANMVMPLTECSFCQAARDEQQPHLARLARLGHRLIQVPLFPYPIQGVEQLRLVTAWLGGNS